MPVVADINARGCGSSILSNMKSCVTLVLLLRFLAFNAFADQDNAPDFIPINVFNVTMKNSSLMYPDVLVLLPNNFTAAQRAEFMDQLALGMVGDIIESPDNDLSADTDGDFTRGTESALQEAARQIASLNATRANLSALWAAPGTGNTSSHQIYAVIPTVTEEYIRKRRSLERLAPLSRVKRTSKKHDKGGGCMICQLMQPKQPIVINVYKQGGGGGCGGGCGQHYQPPPCGQPQCGYHPQPPPVYHPPPQQTCDPCSRQPSYQQPAYHQPASNSYSYSQASSSSSSGSYGWGKKK